MTVVNVKHSSASDPKINTIRFIENALRETQRLKAALSKDPKNFSTMDKFIEKDLRRQQISSTVVPRIPKSISSGIDLLKMHYEKHGGQRQRCV